MRSFTITAHDDGIRLNRYLQRVVPALSAGAMYKYLRTKRIKLNGRRCEASTRLHTGDELALYIDDSFLGAHSFDPAFPAVAKAPNILYEDANIVILYKPAGLLSHSMQGTDDDTLIHRLLYHLYQNGEYRPSRDTAFVPALCNRLDRNTEGIVIAAKNAASLGGMNTILREQRVKKYYLCAVSGQPPRNGLYHAFLHKNQNANTAVIHSTPVPGAKPITTGIRTLKTKDGLSLLEIDLVTGRPHQIRAHLARLGCPVLGDPKYGDPVINKKYRLPGQALCACKIVFCLDEQQDAGLYYLNGKSFSLQDPWFVRRFFE